MRWVVALVAAGSVAVAGCDPGATLRAVSPSPSASAQRQRLDADGRAPKVRMQAGTDSVPGVLTRWCDGDRCREEPEARPRRAVKLAGRGIVYFMLGGVRPRDARVVISSKRGVVDSATLRPGTTTPAYSAADLPKGSYVVSLSASWAKRRAQWVFALTVPARLE